MPRHTLLLIVTATVTVVTEARGRYEFIEEADLPAFYSMRSAQMAQKAQLSPQVAAMPQDPYSPYYPYQMYHHQSLEIPAAAAYSPFAVYSPVYRAPAAAAPPTFQGRPAPVQYHPMAYFHAAQAGQPQASPIRKKSAKT